MERIAAAMGTLSQGRDAFRKPREGSGRAVEAGSGDRRLAAVAVAKARSGVRRQRSRQMRAGRQSLLLSRRPGDAVVDLLCDGAGKLSAKRRPLRAGRLATAVERARPRHQGRRRRGVGAPRRQRALPLDPQGRANTVTHTAKDGSDPKVVEGVRIVSNAAPAALAPLMPAAAAEKLTASLRAADARRLRCSR